MSTSSPLVTIGIPTYNRASLLHRSIESALRQDYRNIEIIISDNASTDDTGAVCHHYSEQDERIKYVRQAKNCGATVNFSKVLEMATGQFFMWLGDDDWIDASYVSSCVQLLLNDQSLSLVSGTPHYYRDNQPVGSGKTFDLVQKEWWKRLASYYYQVADNGTFYGVMRTEQIRAIHIPNLMGGDWHLIANIVAMGGARVVEGVSINRELGGATTSYRKIATTLGLSSIHAFFPFSSMAVGAWRNIVRFGEAFHAKPKWARMVMGMAAFALVITRPAFIYMKAAIKRLRQSKLLPKHP